MEEKIIMKKHNLPEDYTADHCLDSLVYYALSGIWYMREDLQEEAKSRLETAAGMVRKALDEKEQVDIDMYLQVIKYYAYKDLSHRSFDWIPVERRIDAYAKAIKDIISCAGPQK